MSESDQTTTSPPAGGEEEQSKGASSAKGSSGLLKSGVDPREAARKGVEARRAKKALREQQAEYDALTVAGRAAKALAATLTYEDALELLKQLKQLATHPPPDKPGVAIQAARELREWARLFQGEEDDDLEGVAYEDMTPAQRAAHRAQVERMLAQLEAEAAADDNLSGRDSGDSEQRGGGPHPAAR